MITEYEQYYCKSCCRLFNDIVHLSYYTRNNFVDNQIRLIYNLKRKHEMKQPNYHTRCPHCYSIHNANVKEILNMFIVYNKKTGRQMKYVELYSLKKHSRYAKIHRDIIKKTKTKPLNTINDK